MQPLYLGVFTAAILATSLQAAQNSVWNAEANPALPLRYIETAPQTRLIPQIANAETYASEVLFQQLYPSINADTAGEVPTTDPRSASKTRVFHPFQTRGILSSSYVQEFAYIDTYSNIRKYENNFSFPSIRMSLAMPAYGNGFGGSYPPLQFGFGPAAFWFW